MDADGSEAREPDLTGYPRLLNPRADFEDVEYLKNRIAAALQTISRDGRTINRLQRENEALRRELAKLQGGDDGGEADGGGSNG